MSGPLRLPVTIDTCGRYTLFRDATGRVCTYAEIASALNATLAAPGEAGERRPIRTEQCDQWIGSGGDLAGPARCNRLLGHTGNCSYGPPASATAPALAGKLTRDESTPEIARLRADRDRLRSEVERLQRCLRDAEAAYDLMLASLREDNAQMRAMLERLES